MLIDKVILKGFHDDFGCLNDSLFVVGPPRGAPCSLRETGEMPKGRKGVDRCRVAGGGPIYTDVAPNGAESEGPHGAGAQGQGPQGLGTRAEAVWAVAFGSALWGYRTSEPADQRVPTSNGPAV